ncbi:MAG: hypothetical protein NUK65_10680 [Firmicutes bacterium]|nr:hypothetical protein [Bacillota bacterium]
MFVKLAANTIIVVLPQSPNLCRKENRSGHKPRNPSEQDITSE